MLLFLRGMLAHYTLENSPSVKCLLLIVVMGNHRAGLDCCVPGCVKLGKKVLVAALLVKV